MGSCSLFVFSAQSFSLQQLSSHLQDALKLSNSPLHTNTCTWQWLRITACCQELGLCWQRKCTQLQVWSTSDQVEVTDLTSTDCTGSTVTTASIRRYSILATNPKKLLWIPFSPSKPANAIEMPWTNSTETLQVNSCSPHLRLGSSAPSGAHLPALYRGRKYPGCKALAQTWLTRGKRIHVLREFVCIIAFRKCRPCSLLGIAGACSGSLALPCVLCRVAEWIFTWK